MPRLYSFCSRTYRAFIADEAGFIISAELVLISTLCVLGLVTGLTCIKSAISGEMNDLAAAFKGLDQSYYFSGFHGCRSCKCGYHSYTAGSSYFQENRAEEKATFLEIERDYLKEQQKYRANCKGCTKPVIPDPQPLTPPPVEYPVPTIPCPAVSENVVPETVIPNQTITPVPETYSVPSTPCNPGAAYPIPATSYPVQEYMGSPSPCSPPITNYYLGSGYPSHGSILNQGSTGPIYPPAYPLSGRRIINPDSAYQSMPGFCQ